MKRIFITGICGFVGSNLAIYFQSQGYKVYGIDNLSRKGTAKNFKALTKRNILVYKKDLSQLKKLNFIKKKLNFEALIHCAALTSVLDGANDNSEEFLYKNNVWSTFYALKICKLIRSKFIYISSSRVYSITEINKINFKIKQNYFFPKKTKLVGYSSKGINENFSTTSPVSFYGSSKIISENIVQEYCTFHKMPFLINRCGLLSGSGQFYKADQGIISYWINSWKKNKKLSYINFGERGYQVRDCLHPLDLGNLIKKQINFISRKKLKSKIFNVSGGFLSSFSIKELSLWCEKNISPKKIGRNKINRPFDLKWLILDNTKVRKVFKWHIKYSKYKIFQQINLND